MDISKPNFMSSTHPVIVGLGEVLWDFLPAGKQLGGAPANFAHAAALLGDEGIVASRIGTDGLGDELISKLAEVSLSNDNLQRDSTHSTGAVKVSLDPKGQATFEIVQAVAWDFLEWTPNWHILAQRADAVCFGSLAQRAPQSRDTIRRFLSAMRSDSIRVFDVNLRQTFFSAEVLNESLKLANVAKLNDAELPVVANVLGLQHGNVQSTARKLLDCYELDLLCVTKGESGSLMISAAQSDDHPGFKVQVADTVGAGDAFTAGLVHQYLRKASISEINDLANRLGAWVSSQRGGMPTPSGNLKDILSRLRLQTRDSGIQAP
ncbi:MAG: PfkB family carbohydrate kinase [Terriglobales bacterium]